MSIAATVNQNTFDILDHRRWGFFISKPWALAPLFVPTSLFLPISKMIYAPGQEKNVSFFFLPPVIRPSYLFRLYFHFCVIYQSVFFPYGGNGGRPAICLPRSFDLLSPVTFITSNYF